MFERSQAPGAVDLIMTGTLPFSVSESSPGFQALVRLLCMPASAQGYVPAVHPKLPKLGSYHLSNFTLLRHGSRPHLSSFVYLVQMQREMQPDGAPSQAILKLNQLVTEVGAMMRRTVICSGHTNCTQCCGGAGCTAGQAIGHITRH